MLNRLVWVPQLMTYINFSSHYKMKNFLKKLQIVNKKSLRSAIKLDTDSMSKDFWNGGVKRPILGNNTALSGIGKD